MIFAVVGTLPARGAVAFELLTLPTETGVVHLLWFILTAQLRSLNRSTKSDGPSSFSKHEYIQAFRPARGIP